MESMEQAPKHPQRATHESPLLSASQGMYPSLEAEGSVMAQRCRCFNQPPISSASSMKWSWGHQCCRENNVGHPADAELRSTARNFQYVPMFAQDVLMLDTICSFSEIQMGRLSIGQPWGHAESSSSPSPAGARGSVLSTHQVVPTGRLQKSVVSFGYVSNNASEQGTAMQKCDATHGTLQSATWFVK